jgi:threonine/homoserine/homoserine lactone efflux protein
LPLDQIATYLLFSLVAAITPGPSNVMITATGAAVGVRRGLACALGAAAGMALLLFVAGLGLGSLLLDHPLVVKLMKWAGVAVLLWLAFKIASSPPGGTKGTGQARGVGFFEALAFQFVNPKGWLVGVSAASAYAGLADKNPIAHALALGGLFFLMAFPSGLVWLAGGSLLNRLLGDERNGRIINIAMGLLLAASVVLII